MGAIPHRLKDVTMNIDTTIREWSVGKTYFIQTFGCQLNENDSEKLAGQLEAYGLTAVDEASEADLYLINTCAIRENASDRFFGHLGHSKTYLKHKPDMIIGACGCLMMKKPYVERIKKSFSHLNFLFGPQDLHRLPELLAHAIKGERIYDVGQEDAFVEGLPIRRARQHRALVSIMYGCNNFCSYCVVPYARGRERSRKPEDILNEVQQLVEQGYSEVMLLGQNVNSYGNDQEGEYGDFADLVEMLAKETAIPRIRFMTSHPKDLSTKLISVMARYPQVERHIHLPLQSGSDAVLEAMNRKYDRERYRSIVREIHTQLPDATLSTDIIVGYPTETEEDFLQTLELVEEVGYTQAFMFQFSPRPGTPAAELEEIPAEVMTERFNRLVELQDRKAQEFHAKEVGKTLTLLVEGAAEHEENTWTGRDSRNFLVNFTVDPELVSERLQGEELMLENTFVQVKIIESRIYSLRGELVALSTKEEVARG